MFLASVCFVALGANLFGGRSPVSVSGAWPSCLHRVRRTGSLFSRQPGRRKAAGLLGDTLRSAVANAENNCDLNRKELVVKAALVSPGPIIKRFRAKARGSAGRIRKRTSHLEVILTDMN